MNTRESLAPVEHARTGFADLGSADGGPRNLDAILRIPVTVQVVLGSAVMPVANLMKMGRGTVIPLDQRVGEPVDIVVNGRVVARGEVVVADEETSRFGVSLTELLGPAVGTED
jgi:flagellar motor switch protein FliN